MKAKAGIFITPSRPSELRGPAFFPETGSVPGWKFLDQTPCQSDGRGFEGRREPADEGNRSHGRKLGRFGERLLILLLPCGGALQLGHEIRRQHECVG